MLSYRLAFYCDICIVSLKYFFIYGTLNLTFLHYITLHYITLHYKQTDKPTDTTKIMVTWPWTNTVAFRWWTLYTRQSLWFTNFGRHFWLKCVLNNFHYFDRSLLNVEDFRPRRPNHSHRHHHQAPIAGNNQKMTMWDFLSIRCIIRLITANSI